MGRILRFEPASPAGWVRAQGVGQAVPGHAPRPDAPQIVRRGTRIGAMVTEIKITGRCDVRRQVENKALVVSELCSDGLRVENSGISLASVLAVV